MKWARKCNGIVIYNWMYIADVKTLAKLDYKIMIMYCVLGAIMSVLASIMSVRKSKSLSIIKEIRYE